MFFRQTLLALAGDLPVLSGYFLTQNSKLFQVERALEGVKAEDRVKQGKEVGPGALPRTWRVARPRKVLVP